MTNELVVACEVVNDTMEDVIKEADEKNYKHIAEDLAELGNLYECAKVQIEFYKDQLKSILERGKDLNITKGMIETYIRMKNYDNLNRMAVMGAVNNEEQKNG